MFRLCLRGRISISSIFDVRLRALFCEKTDGVGGENDHLVRARGFGIGPRGILGFRMAGQADARWSVRSFSVEMNLDTAGYQPAPLPPD